MEFNIVSFESVKGSGMTLSAIAIAYRQFLGSKEVVFSPILASPYTYLTEEELVREFKEGRR